MIAIMQAADAGYTHEVDGSGRPSFDNMASRRLLPQGILDAIFVVIPDVLSNEPTEMKVAQHNYMVEQFRATASHPAVRNAVLPWAAISRPNQLAAEVIQHRRDLSAEPTVTRSRTKVLGCTDLRKASRSCCMIY
jgi:hypothetical protein